MSNAALAAANAARWSKAKLTRAPAFDAVARRLVAGKARYQAISATTGVPWFVIAVIHQREASQDWKANIAQGDPWNAPSRHVPIGRGPFQSFESAAVDALTKCPPFAGSNKDWSVGGTLALLEAYNGLGYATKGLPSPYIWSGTDQYSRGKYVADHVFDPNVVDVQLGCAGLILAMQAVDATIRFGAQAPAVAPAIAIPAAPKATPSAPASPSIANPAKGSIGAWIASFFRKGT